jgi:hypothetical protein
MTHEAKERSAALIANLKGHLGPDRSVLVVAHKAVEPHLIGLETPFSRFDVGHWGAIDGRNDWNDYDTAVIFGLSYRDRIWSSNVYMAIQGLQTSEWLSGETPRSFKRFEDVRQALEEGQLTVSIVQAINRVRSRRVVDVEGNCSPVDVYIMLPWDKTGDAVLAGIKAEMPGIKVAEWDFNFGTKAASRGPKANTPEALIRFMGNRLPGEASATELKKALGISDRQWDRLSTDLKAPKSDLACRLSAIGVHYHVEGRGRGSRSYLLKA